MARSLKIGKAYKESDLEVGIKYIIKNIIDLHMIYTGTVDGKHEFIEKNIAKNGRINGWINEEDITFSEDGKIIVGIMSYQSYYPGHENKKDYESKKGLIEKAFRGE